MLDTREPDTVRRVCAWCGGEMGLVARPGFHKYPVTHGICPTCDHILSNFKDIPLEQLVCRLDGPVLVVDGTVGLVVAANDEAAASFGKTVEQMSGQLGGNVMECVNAGEPGGCGAAVHCSGCTIRMLVGNTAVSGEGQDQVPAYQFTVTPAGIRKRYYLVSTEKLGELVLLRIDSLPGEAETRADP